MNAAGWKVRGGRIARVGALAAALALVSVAPAAAQWLGHGGPIPPGQIVGSLMRRGFVDVGRPRFDGDAYVVEGVNARGMRLRLVIDAFDGEVISRTRLDDPLLPPRDVGRERSAGIEPFRPYPPEEMNEDLPPRVGGRIPERWRVEREELPPPPLTQPRRGERVTSPETTRPKDRQAKRVEPPAASPSASPPAVVQGKAEQPKEKSATAAAPATPQRLPEAAPVAPPAPAPVVDQPREAKPAGGQWQEPSTPKTVRVIEGITPVVPKAPDQPPSPATAPPE